MTISQAFKLYRDDVISFKNQSAKTEENHFVCMRSLINYFGDANIADLSFQNIRDWKLSLDKSKSPQTSRNYVIKLRVVLTYLSNNDVECINPNLIPVPKRVETVPDVLTKEEVSLIIKSTKRLKNKAIVSLLFCSGIRVSELCSLDRNSISSDNTFTVIGKGNRPRLCFVDDRSSELIKIYLSGRKDNQAALFLTDGGKRIKPITIQETFKSIRKSTGIQCHPHTLRHSFATNLLKSNTNLFYVKEFLGHRSLDTTKQYLHVVNSDLRDVYNKHHSI